MVGGRPAGRFTNGTGRVVAASQRRLVVSFYPRGKTLQRLHGQEKGNKLEAGHSIECITHAGRAVRLVERRHIAARGAALLFRRDFFALFDPVTLTFDLLT